MHLFLYTTRPGAKWAAVSSYNNTSSNYCPQSSARLVYRDCVSAALCSSGRQYDHRLDAKALEGIVSGKVKPSVRGRWAKMDKVGCDVIRAAGGGQHELQFLQLYNMCPVLKSFFPVQLCSQDKLKPTHVSLRWWMLCLFAILSSCFSSRHRSGAPQKFISSAGVNRADRVLTVVPGLCR